MEHRLSKVQTAAIATTITNSKDSNHSHTMQKTYIQEWSADCFKGLRGPNSKQRHNNSNSNSKDKNQSHTVLQQR
jgi:hypothetical protein